MLGKAVGHGVVKAFGGVTVAVDVDVTKDAKWAQIVYSAHMVVMDVGEQHAINLAEWLCEELLAYVWTAVNEQPRTVGLN